MVTIRIEVLYCASGCRPLELRDATTPPNVKLGQYTILFAP